jgi:T5orf172 domain
MSFSGRTPESLLPRSDSKNPATTCKGITANGRPCRRALAASPRSSPFASPSSGNGVLAVLDEDDAAAFYCWQHKDQAETLAAQPEQKTTLYPLKERSSIDTLADRVGVLDLDEEIRPLKKAHHRRRRSGDQHLTRRDTLPSGWHQMQGPLMTVPEEVKHSRPPKQKEYTYGRSNVEASWTCCIQAEDDEPPPRRPWPDHGSSAPRTAYSSPTPMKLPTSTHDFVNSHTDIRRKPPSAQQPQMTRQPSSRPPPNPNLSSQKPSNSRTQALLSLIPTTLSPQTTSSLLAELSRPISLHDEAGYIYIFWLTPESQASKPDDETASSLLDDDNDLDTSPARHQRISHALQRYASVHKPIASAQDTTTILLKIGRAANVHRRLSQWTKQCGQNITLIRYYPYSPSASNSSSHASPSKPNSNSRVPGRKVPHVHRVERLIHLELAAKRAQKDVCEQCGREHREWFEVEASKTGLRGVDEVVRRWVRWAEGVDMDKGEVGGGGKEVGRDKDKDRGKAAGAAATAGVQEGYY